MRYRVFSCNPSSYTPFGPLADFIDVENLSEEIPVGAMIMCMQAVSGSLAGT